MSGLAWLLTACIYLIGWFISAVKFARAIGEKPRCHYEGTNNWGYTERHCKQYDPETCWRGDSTPSLNNAGMGTLVAFLWPVALVPLIVWQVASRGHTGHLLTPDALAALEREAGIR